MKTWIRSAALALALLVPGFAPTADIVEPLNTSGFSRARLAIETTVEMGKTMNIAHHGITVAWQLARAAIPYAATHELGASAVLLLEGMVTGYPMGNLLQRTLDLKIRTNAKQQKFLRELLEHPDVEKVYMIQGRKGGSFTFFPTRSETEAYVYVKTKSGRPFQAPNLSAEFGGFEPIRSLASEKIRLQVAVGGKVSPISLELPLREVFDGTQVSDAYLGRWRAFFSDESRKTAYRNFLADALAEGDRELGLKMLEAATPEEIAKLEKQYSRAMMKIQTTWERMHAEAEIRMSHIDELGKETPMGLLANGPQAKKFLKIGAKPGVARWVRGVSNRFGDRFLYPFFTKFENPSTKFSVRTDSANSFWFCWREKLSNAFQAVPFDPTLFRR